MFCKLIEAEKIEALALPPRSPNLNAFAERWVRSVKEECFSKLILFGEHSLKRALRHYEMHYHLERNHQGKDNLLLFLGHTDQRSNKQRCDAESDWVVCSNSIRAARHDAFE